MKKKLTAGILSLFLVAGLATVALGATDQTKLNELKSLYQQMFGLQKQIIQKEVEAGALTQDQANYLQNMLEQKQKYQEQALDNGVISGPGLGCWGGYGLGPGYGPRTNFGPGYGRFGGMMGPWGAPWNGNVPGGSTSSSQQ